MVVLLVVGCFLDVRVWQQACGEINDPNFVLIGVAENPGGEAAAGAIFDAANSSISR